VKRNLPQQHLLQRKKRVRVVKDQMMKMMMKRKILNYLKLMNQMRIYHHQLMFMIFLIYKRQYQN
jgi:hypothetical protein